MAKIFIPGNVPSSKNSKQWTGKMLINSKATRKYISNTKIYYMKNKMKFRKMLKNKRKPYKIYFEFIRGTKHKFDYINPAQTIQDLMVKNGWIMDDNCDEMMPIFAKYKYDKNNCGVYIWVGK